MIAAATVARCENTATAAAASTGVNVEVQVSVGALRVARERKRAGGIRRAGEAGLGVVVGGLGRAGQRLRDRRSVRECERARVAVDLEVGPERRAELDRVGADDRVDAGREAPAPLEAERGACGGHLERHVQLAVDHRRERVGVHVALRVVDEPASVRRAPRGRGELELQARRRRQPGRERRGRPPPARR